MAERRFRVKHAWASTFQQGQEITEQQIRDKGHDPDDWLKQGAIIETRAPAAAAQTAEQQPQHLQLASGTEEKQA